MRKEEGCVVRRGVRTEEVELTYGHRWISTSCFIGKPLKTNTVQ